MVMNALQQRRQQAMLEAQQANQMANQQSSGGNAMLEKLGGLIGTAMAKRSDGVNDSIGDGVRYTNDGSKGAFNDSQIQSLQDFAKGGYNTDMAYGNLANQKFTIGGNQYQADRNGVLSMIPQQQPSSIAGLSSMIPQGASSIGLDNEDMKAYNEWKQRTKNAVTFN